MSWSSDKKWNAKQEKVFKNVDWGAVKKFVEKEILMKGTLGADMQTKGLLKNSDILKLVPGDMQLAYYYNMHEEHDFASEGVHEIKDHGVVFDVLKLNCEAKRAFAIAAMASHLHYLHFKKTTINLTLSPSKCSNTKKFMKLTEIKATLRTVCGPDNGTMNRGMLRRQLLPRFDDNKKIRVDEQCPDLQKLSASKVALQLEVITKIFTAATPIL
jgi:hypothetical protein